MTFIYVGETHVAYRFLFHGCLYLVKYIRRLMFCLCNQVVQDLPAPIPFDIPMVLIKPPQACSTAEVYKVIYVLNENHLENEIQDITKPCY